MDFLEERYSLAREKIREIAAGEDKIDNMPEKTTDAFTYIASLWIKACGLYDICKEKDDDSLRDLWKSESFAKDYLKGILPGNYENTVENPAYAIKMLKRKNGQLFTFMANEVYLALNNALNRELELLTVKLELFIEIFCIFRDAFSDSENRVEAEKHGFELALESISSFMRDNLVLFAEEAEEPDTELFDVNPQFLYDHRCDAALWLDSLYLARYAEMGKHSAKLKNRIFGASFPEQNGFAPTVKRENISFTPAQKKLIEKYSPEKVTV